MENNYELHLYYPDYQSVLDNNKRCKIEEDTDDTYVSYINKIINKSQDVAHNDSKFIRSLRLNGNQCIIKLYKDSLDNKWYDMCEYQIDYNAYVKPIGFIMTNPKDFCNKFFSESFEWTEYSKRKYGQPKLKKPKELSGIKPFASIPLHSKSEIQIFIHDNDVYLKCSDYFSPEWEPPDEDIGKPTSYILKKYFNKGKSDKFIYADCWGSIVLRNEAWLLLKNALCLMRQCDTYLQLNKTIYCAAEKFYGWKYGCGEWKRFIEKLSDKLFE